MLPVTSGLTRIVILYPPLSGTYFSSWFYAPGYFTFFRSLRVCQRHSLPLFSFRLNLLLEFLRSHSPPCLHVFLFVPMLSPTNVSPTRCAHFSAFIYSSAILHIRVPSKKYLSLYQAGLTQMHLWLLVGFFAVPSVIFEFVVTKVSFWYCSFLAGFDPSKLPLSKCTGKLWTSIDLWMCPGLIDVTVTV